MKKWHLHLQEGLQMVGTNCRRRIQYGTGPITFSTQQLIVNNGSPLPSLHVPYFISDRVPQLSIHKLAVILMIRCVCARLSRTQLSFRIAYSFCNFQKWTLQASFWCQLILRWNVDTVFHFHLQVLRYFRKRRQNRCLSEIFTRSSNFWLSVCDLLLCFRKYDWYA